jgi:hypothetical protein
VLNSKLPRKLVLVVTNVFGISLPLVWREMASEEAQICDTHSLKDLGLFWVLELKKKSVQAAGRRILRGFQWPIVAKVQIVGPDITFLIYLNKNLAFLKKRK